MLFSQNSNTSNLQKDLNILLNEITNIGKIIMFKVSLSGILETPKENINNNNNTNANTNIHGENIKPLDEIANNLFKTRLLSTGLIHTFISEEEENPIYSTGNYVVAIDPCDGSSNIDCNVPVGTIFGVWDKNSKLCGKNILCSGYIIYGPALVFVYTMGNGVYEFTYNNLTDKFILTKPNIKYPKHSKCYSINESYFNQWNNGVKNFINWIKTPNKDEHRPYTARYVGSLVSDFHRNLLYGGIFIYPTNKLRLLYECAPLAFIAEQADGLGTDGKNNILDIVAKDIHHKTPLYIGSKSDVLKAFDFLKV